MDPKHSVSLSGHASATGYPSNAVIGGAVSADDDARCVALALGGGGARGLAHLGVLQVLEAEEMRPTVLAGTSIGGLIAALYARSIPVAEFVSIARGFRFPRRFIPGRLLGWHEIFPTAVRVLADLAFEDLATPLAISAVGCEFATTRHKASQTGRDSAAAKQRTRDSLAWARASRLAR